MVIGRKGGRMGLADSYLYSAGRDDVLSGGSRLIPVTTPAGSYRVG